MLAKPMVRGFQVGLCAFNGHGAHKGPDCVDVTVATLEVWRRIAVIQLGRYHYKSLCGKAVGHIANMMVYTKGLLQYNYSGIGFSNSIFGYSRITLHIGAVGYFKV